MSPSPQQLMPHTLNLQPGRTQTLGKEKSEGAPRGRVEEVASGPEGTAQTSPDTPGCSLPRGRELPTVAAWCPERHQGPGLDDPSVTRPPCPSGAPPGAEAVVPVCRWFRGSESRRCRPAPQPLTNPPAHVPQAAEGFHWTHCPLTSQILKTIMKCIRRSLGALLPLGIRPRNRVLLTCNVWFRARLKTVGMLRRMGAQKRTQKGGAAPGQRRPRKGSLGGKGSKVNYGHPICADDSPRAGRMSLSREDWSHVPVWGCPGSLLSPPAPTGEQ